MQNFKIQTVFFFFLPLIFVFYSCTEKLDTADPAQSFTKIYNENSFSNAITAIDVVETDEGFLILSTKQVPNQPFPGISLLAIDKEGKVVKQTDLDSIYVSPAKGMFKLDTAYRFLSMDGNTSSGYITEVNKEGTFIKATPLNLSYPLCMGLANNGSYLVLGYSQANRETIFANYSTSLSEIWERGYPIFESVDQPVFGHLENSGKRYPFAVGQTGSNYYFNGFRNFTFSMVFVNTSDRAQTGVVNGNDYTSGLSSVLHLEGNNFALARFDKGANYIIPKRTLSTNAVTSSLAFEGRRMLELEPDAAISVNKFTLNGRNVLIYASNTIDKQIALYVYDEATSELINSQYFGLSIPLEFASMVPTKDGGLLLVGSAYVEGRFKRITSIKLSKSQVEALVK